MPEITPAAGDRTIVVHRPGVLTWISLAFNAFILLLILIGIVCHHHERDQHQHGRWGGQHDRQNWGNRGSGDFNRRDAGPMRQEWDRRDFGGPRDEDRGPGGDDHRGPGMDDQRGWDGDKRGFGDEKGMDRFKSMTPPSAEAMTDRFMLILTDKLALTDPESAQIRPILQGQIAQFQKDMEAQKAAHQKMIDDAKTKIRAVLTPDQQKQFDQMTAGLGTPASPTTAKPDSK